jgi:hypothetical protein
MMGVPPPEEKTVTKANWLAAPCNRYAYQHVRRILPTQPFARSIGTLNAN